MKIKLGKDLIECLSWSLYENPIVLFREAIQNSIDAFEESASKWSELAISIHLDAAKRAIKITDNGPGLDSDEFLEALGSLGDSKKKHKNLAGCRGIGRLSGLGICDEVVFSSRSKESNTESRCLIDAKGIKSGLLESPSNIELSDFIKKYVCFSNGNPSIAQKSYFSVEFKNIKRLSSDFLINPKHVEEYIQNIAPVPISENHPIVSQINEFYSKNNLPNGIRIQINDAARIEKQLGDAKFLNINKTFSYEEIQIKNDANVTLGSLWLLHHDYLGALAKSPFRGLRFRHKGILIGNEDTFSYLFKEPRFNRWTIGEVHALSPGIRPSVKRDDFEPNELFNSLIYKVRPSLFKIGQYARKSSNQRLEQKLEKKIKEAKPNLKKISRTLYSKLPRSLTREKAIQIAEDIYLELSGKIKIENLLAIFLRAKSKKII